MREFILILWCIRCLPLVYYAGQACLGQQLDVFPDYAPGGYHFRRVDDMIYCRNVRHITR